MARRSAVQRALTRLKKKKGVRKGYSLSSASRFDNTTQGVEIPDINHGAWSYIDQPYSPDYPGKRYDFI